MAHGASTLLLAGATLLFLAAPALADGSPERGAVLAKRWCAACHVVSADQKAASADAPSFAALGATGRMTPEVLADYLAMPGPVHGRMPDFQLGRGDIADLVAHAKAQAR